MYSGTTFRSRSGNLMGVHQKIDRVARRHLTALFEDDVTFPTAKQILHFEGNHGPDGIKRKSPGQDEPWHFIDPKNTADTALLDVIDRHIANLAAALSSGEQERAAFEAAWLAHAITDGLTPAHHFPFEERLEQIRGEEMATRNSIIKKGLMPGDTVKSRLKNNWEFWGAKGLMTMHAGFEAGVASVVPYQRFMDGKPSEVEIKQVLRVGFRPYYVSVLHEVASLKMYENFAKTGWTTKLARQTNQQLMPLIIRAVVLGWLVAARGSQK